jgi:Ca2+-binding RTX toxin-like protein
VNRTGLTTATFRSESAEVEPTSTTGELAVVVGDGRCLVILIALVGRDLLIGGTGVDVLRGGTGDDPLIGGTTTHDDDDDDDALLTLHGLWLSPTDVDTRISSLTQPDGLLAPGSVADDGTPDALLGGEGEDWLFWAAGDGIYRPDPSDRLTTG